MNQKFIHTMERFAAVEREKQGGQALQRGMKWIPIYIERLKREDAK